MQEEVCYVETKNLDGETNLKTKNILSPLATFIHSGSVYKLHAQVDAQKPDDQIYAFKGKITIFDNKDFIKEKFSLPINIDNILLRGCYLRNTEYVTGIVVNVGHSTKMMMNSAKSRNKQSRNEKMLNQFI